MAGNQGRAIGGLAGREASRRVQGDARLSGRGRQRFDPVAAQARRTGGRKGGRRPGRAGLRRLLADASIEAVGIATNHPFTHGGARRLKAGKHVLCETPPTMDAAEAKRRRPGEVGKGTPCSPRIKPAGPSRRHTRRSRRDTPATSITPARRGCAPRHPGRHRVVHRQGEIRRRRDDRYRAAGPRPRLAPDRPGQKPTSNAFAVMPRKLAQAVPAGATFDVEEAASVIVRFEGTSRWALDELGDEPGPPAAGNPLPPAWRQGRAGGLHPEGPVMYRAFGPKGEAKETPIKLPKTVLYPAMMRHFKACIAGQEQPRRGERRGHVDGDGGRDLQSAGSGKSAEVKLPMVSPLYSGGEGGVGDRVASR